MPCALISPWSRLPRPNRRPQQLGDVEGVGNTCYVPLQGIPLNKIEHTLGRSKQRTTPSYVIMRMKCTFADTAVASSCALKCFHGVLLCFLVLLSKRRGHEYGHLLNTHDTLTRGIIGRRRRCPHRRRWGWGHGGRWS